MWQAQVFTLYPEVFPGPLSKGLYGKALSNKLWDLKVINIRDAATDKHKTVDDTPYGGGTGMLLKADVLANSLDQNVKMGDVFGTVEAVKTVSDLFMPISGDVIELNEKLESEPELVNNDPYGDGWMVKIKFENKSELDSLLDAQGYEKLIS